MTAEMIVQEASIAKITRPHLRNVYQRRNFFTLLDKCMEKPVLWIVAPPGAGKTTLVNSYIESRKLQCLWYQIDSSDIDPATFFHYLGVAAIKVNTKKKTPLPHLTPEYLPGIQTFSREYFIEVYKRLKRKSLIVFDNYQEAPVESVLHDLIHEGLGSMPKGINVIIISRTAPPPILSRMRLSQSMEIITYDELRLTAEEVREIASMRGVSDVSDTEIRSMLSRTAGWVAGLVLMLESKKITDFSAEQMDSYNAAPIFDYFAGDFFQRLDEDKQSFLLKLSVLPTMTSNMVMELIGDKQVEGVIAELARKNYFIQTHLGDQESYQFHPLFREFLYARLKERTSPGDLANLERRAAVLLADNGHIDDAARLFQGLGDWNSLATLISDKAPTLLEQGRHRTIEGWLNRMPEHVMNEMPWLSFWKACSLLPFDQTKSRQFFEMSYETFYNRKDPSGIFLSWSGIILAIIHEFDNLKPLDRWIDILDDLLAEYPSFPSREIEVRISLSMFLALSFRCPQHPDIGRWADKAFDILNKTSDSDVHAQACLSLVDYFIWTGDLKRADVIVGRLSKATEKGLLPPYVLIASRFANSLNNWYHGNLSDCITNVYEALELAESKGIYVFNYFIFGCGAVASLTGGDLKTAEKFLDEATYVLDDKKRFCTSYYHHIVACYKLAMKDLAGALEHEQLALNLAIEMGSPFAEAMTGTGMALIHYELGERKKADDEITNALELALKTNSKLVEFICYLFQAHFAINNGFNGLAIERLKFALALGKRKGFVNFHMWRPDIVSRLCVLALEEGIEVEYVKSLIRKRDLVPDDTTLVVESWPWRLKIRIFGGFTIIKDGIPLEFRGKAPKKPMEMLKLLVSLGGKEVPEQKISDVLWPDAEGDNAHDSFNTTLKRLRRLIGAEAAIMLSNSRITLNSRYCWVDIWDFERLIKEAKLWSDEALDRISAPLVERAIELYGKGLSVEVEENPWEMSFYDSIRNKFIRCVIKLGSYREEAGDIEGAAKCYTRGIELEPLSEEPYQKLIMCLDRQGHRTEALAIYKRLSKIYSEALGSEPSLKTKNLYKRLKAG